MCGYMFVCVCVCVFLFKYNIFIFFCPTGIANDTDGHGQIRWLRNTRILKNYKEQRILCSGISGAYFDIASQFWWDKIHKVSFSFFIR